MREERKGEETRDIFAINDWKRNFQDCYKLDFLSKILLSLFQVSHEYSCQFPYERGSTNARGIAQLHGNVENNIFAIKRFAIS